MEFRFRAGDDRAPSTASATTTTWLSSSSPSSSSSCDGYFRAQAMRAGLLGAGAGAGAAPFGWEAIRWEQIREALLREEVQRRVIEEEVQRRVMEGEVQRRVMEEEVRLKLEVEIAVTRRLHGLPPHAFVPPQPPPPPPRHMPMLPVTPMGITPFEEFGVPEGFGRFGPGGRAGFGFAERLLLGEEKKPLPKHKLELREIEPSESSEVPPLQTKATGSKRKVDEIGATAAPPKLQKTAQDWSCALCQVSATSEAGLNEHLGGKKHKAKLAQCGVIKVTNNGKGGPKAQSATKDGKAPADPPKKISIQVDGTMYEVVQKNNYLWCERCRVRCDSNVTMAGHLKGKKHKESSKVWKPIKALRMKFAATAESKLNGSEPVERAQVSMEGNTTTQKA